MRKLTVAGNWKMNGDKNNAKLLLIEIIAGLNNNINVIVCPPYPYLTHVADIIDNSCIKLGAQNLNCNQKGAFTGEVSADMLVDCNVEYVIVGHSERRVLYGESDEIVAKKINSAQDTNLIPILCVGESLTQREKGQTETVISKQINFIIKALGIRAFNNMIIAYEPIWAIGTGKTATPAQAQGVHNFIRSLIADNDKNIAQSISIIYGGSVNSTNSEELFACDDIDGGLVGGASLSATDFLQICK